jgi:hypothetical protein
LQKFTTLLLILISQFCVGQTLNWVKTFGGSEYDSATSIVVDGQGNVYTSGYFNETVDFDPGIGVYNLNTPTGSTGVFVQKLDNNGNFVWAKSFISDGYGNQSLDITLDSQNNIITTGFFSGTADFDPSSNTFNITSSANQQVFIWKLDNNGNFIWAKTLNAISNLSSNAVNTCEGLTVDNQNNIYITGVFHNQVDFDLGVGSFILTDTGFGDAFILKLNSNGGLIWVKQLEGVDYSLGRDVKVDTTGNVYATGFHFGTTDFDPGPNQLLLGPNGNTFGDIYLLKLDSNGNLLWANSYNDGSGNEIQFDSFGNVYLTGFIKNNTDFDPSSSNFILNSSGAEEVFILKLTPTNQFISAIKFDGSGGNNNNEPYDMFVSNDKIYITGNFYASTNFGTSTQPNNITSNGQTDIFLLISDLNLSPISAINFGCSIENDEGFGIYYKNCNIYMAGRFQNIVDFDPQAQVYNVTANDSGPSQPYGDAYVLKLNDLNTTLPPTGNTPQTFCNSATIADLIATGTNLLWYSSPTGGVPLTSNTALVNGNTYYASQNPSGCEGLNRLAVLVNINSTVPPTGNSALSFCNSATVWNLTANGNYIQWYSSPTGGLPLTITTPIFNGVTYYASQTINGCESSIRFPTTVTIESTSPPVWNGTQIFCGPATIQSINVYGVMVHWYATPTGGTILPTNTPLVSGTTYYASQTINGCESINRLAQYVLINTIPNPPTGNFNQSFCNSATIADLTAVGTNIIWYLTPTIGTALASNFALSNGTTYYASQTVNGCESTNLLAVTVSINITLSPIGNTTQSFCNSATIGNLTATGTNIQWYSSPSGGVPLTSTTLLVNGNTYYSSQTIGTCESVIRLPVLTIINSTPTPTGNGNQTFCGSATIANLIVTGTNINWYSTPTGGTILPQNTTLISGNTYYATQTINGCTSLGRLPVIVIINPNPQAPIGNLLQSFCNNATIADLIATGTNINWYTSSIGGVPLANNIVLTNGNTYYASQNINGCEGLIRLPVIVSISTPLAPTGNAIQNFCYSATINNLTAIGTNIQWYSSPSGGIPLSSNTSLINGNIYYASQTVNGCESIIRLSVNVTISIPSAPTGNAIQNFCLSDNPTVSDLQLNQTNIVWYSSLTNTTPLNTNALLINGQTYYASQIDPNTGCQSNIRFAVVVSLINPPIPSGSPIQQFCIENNPTIGSLILNSNQIVWYDSPTNGNVLPSNHILTNGEVVYAEGYETTNNCHSISRFQVEINIINPELTYYNLITVNNNSSNYKLTITGIEKFPINEIQIFNRYGEIVWSSINYNNTSNYFIGKTNVSGVYMENNYLPTGTYYFVINYNNPCEKKELKGFFQIDNSN